MDELFGGEVRALGFHLGQLAAQDRFARDLPFAELEQALVEVCAWFPVYRTYTRDFDIAPRDRVYIEQALELASKTTEGFNPGVLDFLRRVLLLEIPHYIEARQQWLGFVMSWQQFTGPVMAKGYEDTTCYYYNRLISSNEVGSDPQSTDHPGGVEEFHRRNAARLAGWPNTMNATSTHDTKRSEDVRARINVLSEMPDVWARKLSRWRSWNADKKQAVDGEPAPSGNDEYMLYQTLVGAWPLSEEDRPGLRDRIRAFMLKAVREAKTHSHWLRPHLSYEDACLGFVDALLAESEDNVFLKDFTAFHRRVAAAGRGERARRRYCSRSRPRAFPTFIRAPNCGISAWWIRTTGARLTSPSARRCSTNCGGAKRRILPGCCEIWLPTGRTGASSFTSPTRRSTFARRSRCCFNPASIFRLMRRKPVFSRAAPETPGPWWPCPDWWPASPSLASAC